MNLLENILYDLDKSNEFFYGKRTVSEEEIYTKWQEEFHILDLTPFYDANFLHSFLKIIPKETQIKYVENTCKYHLDTYYDSNYVIVTRRAVPSEIAKPESFWSSEHRQVVSGLRNELPLNSPQRLHSVIMVTTLRALEEHGIVYKEGAVTDGEIAIIPTKPFSNFLFLYKSESEMYELKNFLKKGGISRKELLEELKAKSEEKLKQQNFIENNKSSKKV